MKKYQRERLSALVSAEIMFDCTLKQYTSFSIGGPAAAVIRVERRQDLQTLLRYFSEEDIPWRAIGGGSNLLVGDEGYPGAVIILGKCFKKVVRGDILKGGKFLLRVGAGHSLSLLAGKCAGEGLAGLEFGYGIPGTLGGAVVMNAGAWGGEMAQLIDSITVETSAGEKSFQKKELKFSYRSWRNFKELCGEAVITEATLLLAQGDPEELKKRCRDLLARRKTSQPTGYANGGSFFKNPPGDSAGRLIDKCGLKGRRVGGAKISEKHANFIVNTGNASARDVKKLMRVVQEVVKSKYNVELQPEVHFV